MVLLSEGLARRGFDVHVAALEVGGALGDELMADGIPHDVLGRRFPVDPVAASRLRRLVSRLAPDVIHTWSQAAALYASIALLGVGGRRGDAKSGSRRPRLISGQYQIERWASVFSRSVEQRLARRVDQYVSNSAAVCDWCLAQGLPRDKFAIVSSGVPSGADCGDRTQGGAGGAGGTKFASRDELLRELRLNADAKLIGIVGRLVPEKRVRDLIWAADLLRVLHDNLRVLVIGGGPMRRQLERYARLASDLVHIQFLGERGDLGRIMPHLDVLWDGRDNASQSMAILEAMSMGVPVVASDVAVNRELVVEGQTGYLIPIGSRSGRAARARWTDRIFSQSTEASQLSAASRRRALEKFSVDAMVEGYVSLYGGP